MWPLLPLPMPAWPGLLILLVPLALLVWRGHRLAAAFTGAVLCWVMAALGFGSWWGVIQIPLHGLAICAGLLLALWLIRRRTPHLDGRQRITLTVATLLAGFISARLTYLALYGMDTGWIGLDGGMVLLGGVVGAALALALGTRLMHIPVIPVLGAILPPLLLALAIGRLGCWANSCCFGSPSSLPWAHPMPATTAVLTVEHDHLHWIEQPTYAAWRCAQLGSPVAASRHPSQLYEALAALALGLILLGQPLQRPARIAAIACLGYAALRFGGEFLRGDKPPGTPLTDSQWLSLLVAAAGLCLLVRRDPVASPGDELPSSPRETQP